MKTVLVFGIALGIATVLAAPAPADVIVMNSGQYGIGKVSSAASGRLKLTTEYGEQFFPRNQVAGYFLTPEGMEAEGYYQAGLLLVGKGHKDAALKFFQTCVKYDPAYRDKCSLALKGGPSAVAPTATAAAGTPGAAAPTASAARPQTTVTQVQCSECSGTGVIMTASSIGEGSGERPRPCPLCGGKGYKILRIPPGHQICADCGGFGASAGGGRSDSSSFISKKDMCRRCAGRGIVKIPWAPPESTPGEGSSGVMMTTGSPSPTPGTPPHGALSMAKAQAKNVASSGQPTRPVGPAAIRPVSPTFIEDTPPAEDTEEIIEEDDGGASSDTATEEDSEESESEEETAPPPSRKPGISGWVGRHKKYIVLAGVALLVFAVVFNKMSAKK